MLASHEEKSCRDKRLAPVDGSGGRHAPSKLSVEGLLDFSVEMTLDGERREPITKREQRRRRLMSREGVREVRLRCDPVRHKAAGGDIDQRL